MRRPSVAQIKSWAALRETTREEDIAYCMFGLFKVNLPLLYGEGQRVFVRLQEELVKKGTDLSIFAWQEPMNTNPPLHTRGMRGVFAKSPAEFTNAKGIIQVDLVSRFSLTNRGVKMKTSIRPNGPGGLTFMTLGCSSTETSSDEHFGILLGEFGHLVYRACAHDLPLMKREEDARVETIHLVSEFGMGEDIWMKGGIGGNPHDSGRSCFHAALSPSAQSPAHPAAGCVFLHIRSTACFKFYNRSHTNCLEG